MRTSKVVTAIVVSETMRKLGRDAMIRKQWAAAECYGLSFTRLSREAFDEAKRAVYGNGGEDRA